MLSIDDWVPCEICEDGKIAQEGGICLNCYSEGGHDNKGVAVSKQDFLDTIMEDGK